MTQSDNEIWNMIFSKKPYQSTSVGNEIWKEILSEKRLNAVLDWHKGINYDNKN